MTLNGTCPHCGAPLAAGTPICSACGTAVEQAGFSATPTMPPPMAPPAGPPPVTVAAPTGPPPLPPPGPPPTPGAVPPRPKRNPALVIGGIVGAVALVGTVVVLTTGDDDAPSSGATTTLVVSTTSGATTTSVASGPADPSNLQPGEIYLEPVGVPTQDPFTEPAIGSGGETPPTVSLPDLPLPSTSTTVQPGGPTVVPQVYGNNPGLYGGTRDAAACDQQAMIAFLEANPDKAAAWAGVHGIQIAEIRTYIEGLTPVILTRDTRVTNHGFRNGMAYAHPSVLQRGHAVLVDRWGVPRAKCSCGNPLAPPTPTTAPPIYVGDPWPDFDVTVIIIVIAGDPVDDEGFVLVDLTTGDLIIRGIGANPQTPDLATGDIRVTLRWNDAADLDLAVTDPFGETVSYGNSVVSSGGTLDVDANSGCASVMASPAENIVWSGTPPEGRYFVTVSDYADCGAGTSHAFEITVVVGGQQVPLYGVAADGSATDQVGGSGAVGADLPSVMYAFDVGG